ncbi:MAG TPA: alpha/beta hydrolase, partial [Flavitalea sp.]|nr:alpha/beta hydrolase [Flavitalea sp.]
IHLPIPETFLDTVINETMKVPSNVWQGVMKGLLNVDFSKRLKKLKIPTLIMYGEKDNFSSMARQEKLMSQFKNAQLIAYRGVGHAIHWEMPHTVARDVTAFVKMIKTP